MIGCYMTTDIRRRSFSLIGCLLKMTSSSEEMLTNEFDCPLLELEDKFETVLSSSRIYHIVNINVVYECTETSVFRDSTELQTIEREETPRLALIYDDDNSIF